MTLPKPLKLQSSTQYLPEYKGVLETVTSPLKVFNVPNNFVKSIVEAIQEQDTYYLRNAMLTLIPGGGSEHIYAKDIIGEHGFWSELAFDCITDPLMLLGGIAPLTKLGKAKKVYATINADLKVAKQAGDTVRVLRLTEQALKAAKAIPKEKGAERALLNVGLPFTKGMDLGDAALVRTILDKRSWRLLPDLQQESALQVLNKVSRQIAKLDDVKQTDRVKVTLAKFKHRKFLLEKELQGYQKPILPLSSAKKLRSLRMRFKHDSNNPTIRAIHDYSRTLEAEMKYKYGAEKAQMLKDFEELKQLGKIEDTVLLDRLTKGAEARFVQGELPELGKKAQIAIHGERLKASKKLRKAMEKSVSDIDKAKIMWRALDTMEEQVSGIKYKNVADELRLKEAKEFWGTLGIEEIDFINKYTGILKEMPKIEKAHFLDIEPLEVDLVSYLKRILTPEAKKLKKKNPTRYSSIMADVTAKLMVGKKRTVLPDLTVHEANKILRKELGYDFFKTDFLESIVSRHMNHISAISRAKPSIIAVDLLAKKDIRGVSVAKFMKQVGLKPPKGYKKGYRIPVNIVEDLVRSDRIIQHSVFAAKPIIHFLDIVDKINQPFRIGLTVPWPSFHNRNVISNWFLNMLAGVYSPWWYIKSATMQHKMRLHRLGKYTPSENELKLFEDLNTYRLVGDQTFFDELRPQNVERWLKKWTKIDINRPFTGTADNVLESLGKNFRFGEAHSFANPMTGRAFGKFAEENARIAHYLAKRSKGFTQENAMRSVHKYLFDYNKLTEFEKRSMRPMFLFYTWMRNNVPLMIETAFTTPRVATAYSKVIGTQEGEIPRYLKATSAFPNPLGEGYLGSLGLPIEDLNMLNVADVDPQILDEIPRVAEKIISRMSPVLRIPYEIVTGHTAFSRRTTKNIPWMQLAKEATPLSRGFRTGELILDPERPTAFKWLDLLTGIRTYDVSLIRAQLDELNRRSVGSGKYRREGFLVTVKRKHKDEAIVKTINKERSRLLKKLRKERK